MAYIPSLEGGFASADFGDADESGPPGVMFDIGGHGQPTPYSLAVEGIMAKQIEEIRLKSTGHTGPWKRRLREFISQKNDELLEFMKVPLPKHPVLGPGEVLIRRFGNPMVTPSHPSVRDMVMDISGDGLDDTNAYLGAIERGDTPLKDHVLQTNAIYEMYREAGDEALKLQKALKVKLDKLDRIQGKLSTLFEIDPNEFYEPLMQANQDYLKKIFNDNKIEAEYIALMAAYRRFIGLREVVSTSRLLVTQEAEPLCSICLDESVEYALNPCGHTLCGTCLRKQTGSCFICRSPAKDRLKLYFG